MKFSEEVGNGPVNKRLYFGGDPGHRLDTGIVFRIHHCWEIRKLLTESFVRTDSPDGVSGYGDTGKMCLGRGMHCPSASSFLCVCLDNSILCVLSSGLT